MISLTCRGLNPKDRGRRERERGGIGNRGDLRVKLRKRREIIKKYSVTDTGRESSASCMM